MARLAVRGSPAIWASPAPRGRQKMPRASFGGQGGARVLEVVNMPETPGTQHNSAWMAPGMICGHAAFRDWSDGCAALFRETPPEL